MPAGEQRRGRDRVGIGCVSITVHERSGYSEGITPDYGAKQGALSVSAGSWRGLRAGQRTQLFLAARH